ncbi:glutathione S-transferase [Metapseudomonas lalkuanensis]|uniref:Glutathione S-transferase n=1 Tax=Metapseudomonas lalkuanensis TaxID=2604832 RepID=A0A5J6QVK5_9GAMM|nr:glutathione S-transferase [Pseudomonas lalkuanensis]
MKLYHHPLSGHSHRALLALSLLGVRYELVYIDLKTKQQKSPEFLKMNPFGQIPVLDDEGTIITDSNAILVYLAAKYDVASRWIPRDPKGAARVQVWFSVAAGQLAFGPAAARRVTVFGAVLDTQDAIARSHTLLTLMNSELDGRSFLVGDSATFADVAIYSYIVNAPEGNVSLSDYPNVQAWLARVEALPGFVPFNTTAAGLRTTA